jgi:hypothetical protein
MSASTAGLVSMSCITFLGLLMLWFCLSILAVVRL